MRIVLALLATAGILFGTTGCADPCAGLQPTAAESEILRNGDGVERMVNGTECEADSETGGRFEMDA